MVELNILLSYKNKVSRETLSLPFEAGVFPEVVVSENGISKDVVSKNIQK